ncbi:MAG: hypothetical protein WCA56_04580 [Xanthobacteraceae bacterium]
MAVSFGHMHRDDLGLPPLPDPGRPTQIAAVPNRTPAAPANQDRHSKPDDYCPICASMALIATALPSLPPVLLAPPLFRRVWPAEPPTRSVSLGLALSFQARAPPVAA